MIRMTMTKNGLVLLNRTKAAHRTFWIQIVEKKKTEMQNFETTKLTERKTKVSLFGKPSCSPLHAAPAIGDEGGRKKENLDNVQARVLA